MGDRPVAFSGAKLVLLLGGKLVTLLRDDRLDIPWPDHWDLPGGGREGDETPEECVLRETREELSLVLAPTDLMWKTFLPSPSVPGTQSCWFAAHLPEDTQDQIELGDEGQCWALMEPQKWLSHPKSIPHFRPRVVMAMQAIGATRY